jgi:hypothetical protein
MFRLHLVCSVAFVGGSDSYVIPEVALACEEELPLVDVATLVYTTHESVDDERVYRPDSL